MKKAKVNWALVLVEHKTHKLVQSGLLYCPVWGKGPLLQEIKVSKNEDKNKMWLEHDEVI